MAHNTNKGKRFPSEPLTEAEVLSMVQRCSRKAPTGIRNRALLVVLYRTGVRLGEALSLRITDINLVDHTLAVRHGKGARQRVVALDPTAELFLETWGAERARLFPDSIGLPLFCTLKGAPLKQAYVRQLLPRLARKAGIEKRVHPHGMRHTHATELVREGFDLSTIAAQLGHTSLATTDRYVAKLLPKTLVEKIQGRAVVAA